MKKPTSELVLVLLLALFAATAGQAQLPNPGLHIDPERTAVLITDHHWQFGGAVETMMHAIGMFDRNVALTTAGLAGSGADWLARYKPLIEDGSTVVANPHKVYGPETNDLVLQLRKRGVDKVILGGMSANLCTESHLRELLEQGFESRS